MEKPLTITAVSGWAVPSEWFHSKIEEYFPEAKINVLTPSNPGDSQEAERLLKSNKTDLYLGYSLGSLWLMLYQKMLPPASIRAVLAPVLAFTRERDRGGKTPETKLKYLIRQLKRYPKDPSPLQEFYSDAGINISEDWLPRVPENEVLLKGLEFLRTAPVPETENLNAIALVGKEDKFLDGGKLKKYFPQLEIIASASHSPELLLNRLASTLNLTSNE
jgi:hypothetical protein